MEVLLLGNPNVGKSVLFSRLTGVHVLASNYPGTTVEFVQGSTRIAGERVPVIDVPGTYSLEPTCKAEEVSLRILEDHCGGEEGCVVVNVVDSTNLERSLYLTLQLAARKVPMVVCLNLWDEAKHTGITVDKDALERILGVPCVPTVAIAGEGIKSLVERIPEARPSTLEYDQEEIWKEVGRIVSRVQVICHKHHTLRERLGDLAVHPATAIPIAALVGLLSFFVIRFIGEGLISNVFDPLFTRFWTPLVHWVSGLLGGSGLLHDIVVGRGGAGAIDYTGALGLLTTGIYIPIGAVLPYLFSFYLVLSILEDTGYLPRLAVILDTFMHRLGMHGMTIVPMLLGIGCNVPGVMATRILETRRERLIAATLMSITVPCMSQLAMIAGLVGTLKGGAHLGVAVFGTTFLTLLFTGLVLGYFLNKLTRGESPELLMDIPPFRLPYLPGLSKKLVMRTWWFLKEALPWVLFGVFLVNLLEISGGLDFLGRLAAPLVQSVLGLPRDAVGGLIFGFLRKDVAVGMLAPLGLTWRQITVASVVLTMYFPCIATFTIFLKEFGLKDTAKAALLMLATSFTVGGLLNLVLGIAAGG